MDSTQKKLDRRLAIPMFVASALFTLLLAGALHLRVDTDEPEDEHIAEASTVTTEADGRLAQSEGQSHSVAQPLVAPLPGNELMANGTKSVDPNRYANLSLYCEFGMLLLYPIFLLEFLIHRLAGSPFWRRDLLCCLIPPFRLVAHGHEEAGVIYLPQYGWQHVNNKFRERLTRAFNLPMILIALMVLPLLAFDFKWQAEIQSNPTLALLTHLSESLIWFAFTLEFLVMISIVERKGQYCKQHWMDIAIILLPLIAFLRAARLGRLLRLQQFTKTARLTRTARIYRLKGLALRAYRALLVLEAVERLLKRNPEKRLAALREELIVKQQGVADIEEQIAALEASLNAESAVLAEHTVADGTAANNRVA